MKLSWKASIGLVTTMLSAGCTTPLENFYRGSVPMTPSNLYEEPTNSQQKLASAVNCATRPVGAPAQSFLGWCNRALAAEADYFKVLGTPTTPAALAAKREVLTYASQQYALSGIALSNQFCDDYMTEIGLRDVTFAAGRTLVGDIQTLSTTVQAAAASTNVAVGTTAAALGFVSSTLNNGRSNFAFDGQLQTVYVLVKNRRAEMVRGVSGQLPTDPLRASIWLNLYHDTCSFMAIRQEVEGAMRTAANRSADAAATPPAASSTAPSLASVLQEALKLSEPLTEQEITIGTIYHISGDKKVADLKKLDAFKALVDAKKKRADGTEVTLDDLFKGAEGRGHLVYRLMERGQMDAYTERAKALISKIETAPADGPPAPEAPAAPAPETPAPRDPPIQQPVLATQP